MTADHIFCQAKRISDKQERKAFLRDACNGDEQLLEEVISRLSEASESETSGTGSGEPRDGETSQARETLVVDGESAIDALGSLVGDSNFVQRTDLSRKDPPEEDLSQVDFGGRYAVDEEIARGGMGVILRARDNLLGRNLAVKMMLGHHADSPEIAERFVEEAQIGGQLQHPGIVPVYDLGQSSDDRPFFTMKLVKGVTLADLLRARASARDDWPRFLGIFEQICQTMAFAHSRCVIHRDLKPSNIMVGAFGEVQVMDWGLAKVLVDDEEAKPQKKAVDRESLDVSMVRTRRSEGSQAPDSIGTQTRMGEVLGTPAYMSPEQALGEIDNLDQRADVFGLGAILCCILTGKPPYKPKKGESVLRMAIRGKLEPCFKRLEKSGADKELLAIVHDCLTLEPEDRLHDASVVAARITVYLESVQDRLREVQLERSAEAARAEEAIRTAEQERLAKEAAEKATANEQRARQEAQAREAAERKRRRVTLALAASILLTMVVGGVAMRWLELKDIAIAQAKTESEMEEQRREREAQFQQAQRESQVREALATATVFRDEGNSSSVENMEPWNQADAAAKRAEVLLDTGLVSEQLRHQVEVIRDEIAIAIRNRKLLVELERIWGLEFEELASMAHQTDPGKTVANPQMAERYRQAFRAGGMDINQSSVADAIVRIRELPGSMQAPVFVSLDRWNSLMPTETNVPAEQDDQLGGTHAGWLTKVLVEADHDPWRKALRKEVEDNNTRALMQRAQSPELENQPRSVLIHLAELIWRRRANIKSLDNQLTWQVLQPSDIRSRGGATFTREDDGSIVPGGINPDFDAYTVEAPLSSAVTAVRLEMISDERFAFGNAGRSYNGNFRIEEVKLTVLSESDSELKEQPVRIRQAWSNMDRVSRAFDDDPTSFLCSWETRTGFAPPHVVVFELDEKLDDSVTALRVLIDSGEDDGGEPGHNVGRFRLSVASDNIEDPQPAAIALLKKMHRQSPSDFWANYALAQLLALHEPPRFDEALPYATAAIALRPESYVAQIAMVRCLNLKGRDLEDPMVELALHHAKQARDIGGLSPILVNQAWFTGVTLGGRRYKEGQRDLGLRGFEMALDLDPHNSHVLLSMHMVHRDQGNFDDAYRYLALAKASDPEDQMVYWDYALLYDRDGNWQEAARNTEKRIELLPPDQRAAVYPRLSLRLLLAGEVDNYRKLRDELLEQYGDTESWQDAITIAMAALQLDDEGEHLDRIGRLLDRANQLLDVGNQNASKAGLNQLRVAETLLAYRQQRFELARTAAALTDGNPIALSLLDLIALQEGRQTNGDALFEIYPILANVEQLPALHEDPEIMLACLLTQQALARHDNERQKQQAVWNWLGDESIWRSVEMDWNCDHPARSLQVQPDQSVTLSGDAAPSESYTATWKPFDGERLSAIRLQTLPDPGERWALDRDHLDFTLVRLVSKQYGEIPLKRVIVPDSIWQNYPGHILEDDTSTGWSPPFYEQHKPHRLIITLAEPVQLSADDTLTLKLYTRSPESNPLPHAIRIMLASEPSPNQP